MEDGACGCWARIDIVKISYKGNGPVLIALVAGEVQFEDRFFGVGVETAGSSPEEFGATVKSEMTRLGAVIRDAGIRVD